jgi:hypothetical protein
MENNSPLNPNLQLSNRTIRFWSVFSGAMNYQCSGLGASAHISGQNRARFQVISSENLARETKNLSLRSEPSVSIVQMM